MLLPILAIDHKTGAWKSSDARIARDRTACDGFEFDIGDFAAADLIGAHGLDELIDFNFWATTDCLPAEMQH